MSSVAYCISGEMRALDVWQTHISNIISPYDADVFLHTWNRGIAGSSDDPFKERHGWSPYVYSNFEALAIINPKSFLVEDKKNLVVDYCSEIERQPEWAHLVPRERCFYMWRSWYYSYLISNFRKPYDVIIKTRTDLLYDSKIDVDLNSMESGTVYIPDRNDSNGYCDWFAMGKHDAMSVYCSLYLKVGDYMKQNVPLHPEIMLKHHLNSNNISVKRFDHKWSLHRTFI